MRLNLPSIPYPPSGDGYWSPVTSTLNWCEEDYYATVYSAEIVNTLTNLIFVYLAWKGISSCIEHGHSRVFLTAFITYLCIGLGSVCFHSTLKYPMQLVDELSMIYTTCVMFYGIYSFSLSAKKRVILALFTAFLAIFTTAYYHYLGDPVFHQAVFAGLTATVVIKSMHAMETTLRPSRRSPTSGRSLLSAQEKVQIDHRDLKILQTMWQMIACGLCSVALGFLIWNLDNEFCTVLRRWRRDAGLPWGLFLEGHGWWHVFTGIAAYFNLTWSIWLRYCLNGMQDEVELLWPSLLSVPMVVKRKAHGA